MGFNRICLLVAASLVVCLGTPILPSFYHSHDEIMASIDEAVGRCGGIEVTREGDKETNIQSYLLQMDAAAPKDRYVIFFNEHPRELITAEVALHLVTAICSSTTTMEGEGDGQGGEGRQSPYETLLSKFDLLVVPIANPRGRSLVLDDGDFCRRGNIHGVDINRNWGSHFSKVTTEESLYPGLSPFSETETQTLRNIVSEGTVKIFLSVHSGAASLMTPSAWSKRGGGGRIPHLLSVLQSVKDDSCEQCKIGPIAQVMQYESPGNCVDFAFEELHIPYVYAMEVFDGTLEPTFGDVFRFTSLLRGSGLNKRRNSEAVLAANTGSGGDATVGAVTHTGTGGDNGVVENEVCFRQFNPDTLSKYNDVITTWGGYIAKLGNTVYDYSFPLLGKFLLWMGACTLGVGAIATILTHYKG